MKERECSSHRGFGKAFKGRCKGICRLLSYARVLALAAIRITDGIRWLLETKKASREREHSDRGIADRAAGCVIEEGAMTLGPGEATTIGCIYAINAAVCRGIDGELVGQDAVSRSHAIDICPLKLGNHVVRLAVGVLCAGCHEGGRGGTGAVGLYAREGRRRCRGCFGVTISMSL